MSVTVVDYFGYGPYPPPAGWPEDKPPPTLEEAAAALAAAGITPDELENPPPAPTWVMSGSYVMLHRKPDGPWYATREW